MTQKQCTESKTGQVHSVHTQPSLRAHAQLHGVVAGPPAVLQPGLALSQALPRAQLGPVMALCSDTMALPLASFGHDTHFVS